MEYSPPRRGGVAAASTKSCGATESAADGVVGSISELIAKLAGHDESTEAAVDEGVNELKEC